MATIQSEVGKINLFFDFFTGIDTSGVADNTTTRHWYDLGPFKVCGQGANEIDAGVFPQDALSGVGRITTTDETDHAEAVCTGGLSINVGKMAPIVMEARVELNNLDTKEVFFGLSDISSATFQLEGVVGHGATTTMTLTASDLCGFWLSAELTEDEMWHAIYNGGTTTGETVSTNLELGVDAVAGEFNILRLEIDPNGTARWYIDGVLRKTVAGAVSTTTDLSMALCVEAKGAAVEELDVDYLLLTANRDWTV